MTRGVTGRMVEKEHAALTNALDFVMDRGHIHHHRRR